MTHEVVSRVEHFRGVMFDVLSDRVTMPGGNVVSRDYIRHVGAVGVLALDDSGRVLLVRQYRHAIGERLWELPAGLVDVAGEEPMVTAARELAEEADLTAEHFEHLIDLHASPGCSNELVQLFLARGLSPVPEEQRFERHDEEAEIVTQWFDLDEALKMALRGEITNAAALVGLFAAARLRDRG